MNIATWIVSGLLAALYLMASGIKGTQPLEKLRASMPWTEDLSLPVIRFIAAAEGLGALGLVLPKLTGVVDERAGVDGTLTGLAATGLVAVQALAIPTHLRRGEAKVTPLNLALLLGAAFVAGARFGWFS